MIFEPFRRRSRENRVPEEILTDDLGAVAGVQNRRGTEMGGKAIQGEGPLWKNTDDLGAYR